MNTCEICDIEIEKKRKYCDKCGYEVNIEELKISSKIKTIERYSKLIKSMKDKHRAYDKNFTNTMRSNVRKSEGARIKQNSDFKDLWRDL